MTREEALAQLRSLARQDLAGLLLAAEHAGYEAGFRAGRDAALAILDRVFQADGHLVDAADEIARRDP